MQDCFSRSEVSKLEEKYYKEISKKLTIIIKLLIRRDEELAKGRVEPLLHFLEGTDFTNEDIAEISGVAAKTVANVKSKIKKGRIDHEKI